MSLRALLRVPLVVFATLFAHGTIVLSLPLRLVAPGLQLRLRNAAFRRWGRQICRVMGVRVTTLGRPPAGPFFLVANHVSYVDVPLIASQVDAAFVAKADLRRWPLLGLAFRAADTIFIDRTRKRDLLRVMGLVEGCLEQGLGVLVFPEGTSGPGDEILRLKPSLLQLAAEKGHPVHYVTLSYRMLDDTPARRRVCWWDDTPFLSHLLRLLGVAGFEAVLRFGDAPVLAADRKALAEELRAAMVRSFTPMT